ncbi:MAG: 3-keto-disaccharide hydrolase [Planctomycetota bacterium]|jgi:hypothetical protein
MPKKNILKVLLCLAAAMLSGCTAETRQCPTGRWLNIFNGRDLTGWQPKFSGYDLGENFADTFRVEDGILKVAYDNYDTFDGQFGHLYYKDKFSHYRIRLEYRFVGNQLPGGPDWGYRNSGIMLHCQPPRSIRKHQDFPVCIEAQLLGGDGQNPRSTGNVCTPGTHIVMDDTLITNHCTDSSSQTYHGEQWVTAEIEVRGSRLISHIINGNTVLEYKDPQFDPDDPDAAKLIQANNGQLILSEGYIAVQAESHPVHFRNIRLLPPLWQIFLCLSCLFVANQIRTIRGL